MTTTRVPGTNRGDIVIYTLTTCGWCKKTKTFLNDLGVEYCYIDVDMLKGAERDSVTKEMTNWNPNRTFPTVVINKEKCIIGFKEEAIKDALGL
jgi:glutaredoxin-like protein NrdH